MAIAYWVVVFLGAFTLVVEAYRQFSKPIDVHSHERYPILSNVNVQDLCTSGEHSRGFIVYVSLYLGAYATILGSAEVYQIVANTAEALNVPIGASDDVSDSTSIVSHGSELGKPIFISAIIIAALSMGIFAPIERTLRSYSHWIAGIPRGIYRVISEMDKQFDSLDDVDESPFNSPLRETFDKIFSDEPNDSILSSTIKAIRKTLTAIDLIEPVVTGGMRGRIFASLGPGAIDGLINEQKRAHDDFETKLHSLCEESEKHIKENKSKKELKATLLNFLASAITLRNNHQALFSILYLRNEKQIELLTGANAPELPIAQIISDIQGDRDPEFNALVGAVLMMSFFIMIVHPIIYYISRPPLADMTNAVLYGYIRNETILSILFHGLLFSACAATAILTRETSKEYGRWKHWELSEVPFGRFAKHALFPGIVAVVISVFIKTIEYTISAEGGSFDEFVRTNWAFCLMHFVSGGIIAMCVFAIADQHRKEFAIQTLLIALVFIIPYVLWAVFVQSLDIYRPSHFSSDLTWRIREVSLLTLAPVSFALFFSALVEWSEDESTSKAPSTIRARRKILIQQKKDLDKRENELGSLEKNLDERADELDRREDLIQQTNEKPSEQSDNATAHQAKVLRSEA